MPLCSSFLSGRGIIEVTGEERIPFLQGLITNNLHNLEPNQPLWAGILTPQGKYLFDFLIYERPDSLWLDIDKMMVEPLLTTLKSYKLRAKVEFQDLSETMGVGAVWSENGNRDYQLLEGFPDPRYKGLGYRVVAPLEGIEATLMRIGDMEDPAVYRAHRIACGIPELAEDCPEGDLYWLEACAEALNGVSFQKGCYVGQEVTARMKHKDALKKQIIAVTLMGFAEAPAPLKTDVWDVGTLIATSGMSGLALVRLDRWRDAEASMRSVMAGDTFLVRRRMEWEASEEAS